MLFIFVSFLLVLILFATGINKYDLIYQNIPPVSDGRLSADV